MFSSYALLKPHTIRTSSTLITVPTTHIPKQRKKFITSRHHAATHDRDGILTRQQRDKGQRKTTNPFKKRKSGATDYTKELSCPHSYKFDSIEIR